MHFLSLRTDPHAQYEIRAYADVMLETLARWVPMAHSAFLEYCMNAVTISAAGLAACWWASRSTSNRAASRRANGAR
jgi:thymidylate synthase (FAD)